MRRANIIFLIVLFLLQVSTCIGHYAAIGVSNPLKGSSARQILTIDLVDSQTIRLRRGKVMEAVLDLIMPFPLRFKHVWHLSREKKVMYAWRPIAPDSFVALGTVYTDSGMFFSPFFFSCYFHYFRRHRCFIRLVVVVSHLFSLFCRAIPSLELCTMRPGSMVLTNQLSARQTLGRHRCRWWQTG